MWVTCNIKSQKKSINYNRFPVETIHSITFTMPGLAMECLQQTIYCYVRHFALLMAALEIAAQKLFDWSKKNLIIF